MQKVGLAAFIFGFFGISVGTQRALLSLLSLSKEAHCVAVISICDNSICQKQGGGAASTKGSESVESAPADLAAACSKQQYSNISSVAQAV